MTVLSESCRRAIVAEALLQESEKAHYAKRGYGHRFDATGTAVGEIVPNRPPGSCEFIGASGPTRHESDRAPSASLAQPGGSPVSSRAFLLDSVRFVVASTMGGHRYYCAGRCADPPPLPEGNPAGRPIDRSALANPTLYLWRRLDSRPEAPLRIVRGECCAKRRHFDCLGFVTWCLWKALGPDFPSNLASYEVRHYHEQTEHHPITGPLLPGDLLFNRELSHIGIVVSATEVAHSAGYRWGVRRTTISGPIYPPNPGSSEPGTDRWGSEAGRLTQEIVRRLRRWSR